jgi:glycolate oxidase iron-sulfur subunit
MLRELPRLMETPAAARFSSRVRDVSELLSAAGPKPGATLPFRFLYDAPCHLQHAQGVHAEVLQLLRAIPDLTLLPHEGADQCCGSAGIYSVLQPAMSQAVLGRKVAAIRAVTPPPDFVLTGNPGCLMQIGAGLQAAGMRTRVAHPVEALDWSYRAAGYYGTPERHTSPETDTAHA